MLRLTFPHQNVPDARFVVNSIDAQESLSRHFEYKVELLSDDPGIALKDMLGKLLNIEMVRADGSLRYFSGYVLSFRRNHADGGIAIYEATLGPWLRFLSLRKNNYLFHHKSLQEQTDSIFSDYSLYSRREWRVIGDNMPMTYACQFDETDFNYLSRRWEAAGWHYFYQHDEQGHALIISNDSVRSEAIDGELEVRFHAEGGSAEEDAVDHWVFWTAKFRNIRSQLLDTNRQTDFHKKAPGKICALLIKGWCRSEPRLPDLGRRCILDFDGAERRHVHARSARVL